jgi:hypothetical protein
MDRQLKVIWWVLVLINVGAIPINIWAAVYTYPVGLWFVNAMCPIVSGVAIWLMWRIRP